jgi:hypothetical protein
MIPRPLLCALICAALAACAGEGDLGNDGRSATPLSAALGGPWPASSADIGVRALRRDRALRENIAMCAPGIPDFTADSVGPVFAGQTLADLLTACPHAARGWDRGDQGPAIPALAIRLGSALLTALLLDTLPTSPVAQVESADLATPEGIGSGSSLEELLATYGDGILLDRDCSLEITFPTTPGLAFMLLLPPGARIDCDQIPTVADDNAIDLLPPGTLVHYLIHFGRPQPPA